MKSAMAIRSPLAGTLAKIRSDEQWNGLMLRSAIVLALTVTLSNLIPGY